MYEHFSNPQQNKEYTENELRFPADLHLHSIESDGKRTNYEITRSAANERLNVLALTDHDTVAGYKDLIHIIWNSPDPRVKGLFLIPGSLEIDCTGGVEILGYGCNFRTPDSEYTAAAQQFFGRCRDSRVGAVRKMFSLLEQKLSTKFSPEEIDAITDTHASPSRNHLADMLMLNHFVTCEQEAFDRYLNPNSPEENRCYVQRSKPSPNEAIEFIHQHSGVAVLAHPGNYDEPDVTDTKSLIQMIEYFCTLGIDGLECFYSYKPEKFAKTRLGLSGNLSEDDLKEIREHQIPDFISQMNEFAINKQKLKQASDGFFCITGGTDDHGRDLYQRIGSTKFEIDIKTLRFLCGYWKNAVDPWLAMRLGQQRKQ